MADTFLSHYTEKHDPANGAFSITPADGTDLDIVTRGLNVSAAGNVSVVTLADETVTVHIAAGIVFPLRVKRVLSTGTTATGIVGLY